MGRGVWSVPSEVGCPWPWTLSPLCGHSGGILCPWQDLPSSSRFSWSDSCQQQPLPVATHIPTALTVALCANGFLPQVPVTLPGH